MNPNPEILLTAYALGELPEAERRAIEAQLQNDPERQATVDAIRALAGRLEADLGQEPAPALSDAQRRAILDASAASASRGRLARFPWRTVTGFAAIAAVVTLVFGGAFWTSTRSLHRTLLAQLNETGEMAVDPPQDLVMDELLDDWSPLEELPERVDFITAPHVDMAMLPPPDIQDFAAAPVMDHVRELDIASDSLSPILMRNIAPDAMARRSAEGRPASLSAYGGQWGPAWPPADTESYAPIQGNVFKSILEEPLSTFSIDVDTAAYANIRRFLQSGRLPPVDAVRIEEMLNYFPYRYDPPADDVPFAVHVESAACPWNPAHALVKIGLKGRELNPDNRPPCNLVFLVDVSGSMSPPNRLPLVKKSLHLLARQLTKNDRVSIVVYASTTGLVLPPTPGNQLAAIQSAIDNLQAGGSTAGGAGIRLAYDQARETFLPNGNNRVILCTDGDFNVGITDSEELASFIAERARQGIFLTVLGFGMGNYKDDRLETLSNKGNGNYAYIDTFSEARKTLVEQAAGTLFTIAKDVKLQIEFNPAHFSSYRLVGYENRLLAKEDFNDDRKDAGELGAGHTVTAFYELVPRGAQPPLPAVDPLKYQPQPDTAEDPAPATVDVEHASPEWLTVKLRYKLPEQDSSTMIEVPFTGAGSDFDAASSDFRFAAGVVAAGYLLRNDPVVQSIDFPTVIDWTAAAAGPDPEGYRREFIELLKNAAALAP